MSLLNRIAESQGASKEQAMSARTDAEVDATRPDATQIADEERNAYSQAVAEGADEELEDEAASPQEQKTFTKLEKAMAEKIYGPPSTEIIKGLQANGDVVKNAGALAAAMTTTMVNENGGKLDEEITMAILETAVEQMVDLVESADDSVQLTDDQMAEAYSVGMTEYYSAHPDLRPDEDLKGFAGASAPRQTGGRPNAEVTNENQGAQPTPAQVAEAGIAEVENQPAPIERL